MLPVPGTTLVPGTSTRYGKVLSLIVVVVVVVLVVVVPYYYKINQ